MLGVINFPEGITWDIKYLSGWDMCGEGFSATTMEYAYYGGRMNVIDVKFDTSKVTNFRGAFYNCAPLLKCLSIDTTSAIDMEDLFCYCSSLKNAPSLNTSNATRMGGMFSGCTSLMSVPLLDCSNVTSIYNMFGYSDIKKLTDLGGFKNLKIDFKNGLNHLPNLTVQSLMNVINNLYDFRANGESTTRTLQLGTTNLNKLTDEQKAVATNKGWSLT